MTPSNSIAYDGGVPHGRRSEDLVAEMHRSAKSASARISRSFAVALALVGLLALPGSLASGSPASAVTRYPLSLDNCGMTLTYERAPQRAVGLGQNASEILLLLGLADRMVGTAVWVSPVLPAVAAAEAKVGRISGTVPSFEAVVNRDPDFVASQFETLIGRYGRIGTREQLRDLGIASYVSPLDCAMRRDGNSDGLRSEPFRMELVYREIDELARIFDVEERGQALVADLKFREAAVRRRVAGRATDVSLVFWFSSADVAGDAWVAGRSGASAYIADVLGARNVVASSLEWPLVSWETIAAADPTVIVTGTMVRRVQGADDPAVKRAFLHADPVVSRLGAVRAGRIVEIDAQALNPTIRTVDGLEHLAGALDAMGLLRR